jgi:hypothetical protein
MSPPSQGDTTTPTSKKKRTPPTKHEERAPPHELPTAVAVAVLAQPLPASASSAPTACATALPPVQPRELEDGPSRDVKAMGYLPGWQHIQAGHSRWQTAIGHALSTASKSTRRLLGSLSQLGVFDTLMVMHHVSHVLSPGRASRRPPIPATRL